MRVAAIVAVAIVCATQAQAQVVRTNPDWESRPTQEQLWAVVRQHAPNFVSFYARMQCDAAESGTLENCEVLVLEPEDPRAEQAALAMAPLMRFRPATEDGRPVRSSVTIPIQLRSVQPGFSSNADGSRYRRSPAGPRGGR